MNGKNKILKSGATLLSVVLLLVSVDSAGARERNFGRSRKAGFGVRFGRVSSRSGPRGLRASSRARGESIRDATASKTRSRGKRETKGRISTRAAREERGNAWRRNAGIPERHSVAKSAGKSHGKSRPAISRGKHRGDNDHRRRSGHSSGYYAKGKGRGNHSSRRGIHRGTRHRSDHHGRSRLRLGFGYYSTSYRHRRWISGGYVTRLEEVLVEPAHYEWQMQDVEVEPGRYELQEIPAEEQTVYDEQGEAHTIVVKPARTEAVWIPPRYEQRRVRVWVPDRFETQEVRVWVPGRWIYASGYYPARPHYGLSIGGVFRF